jgi:hypothetical protein
MELPFHIEKREVTKGNLQSPGERRASWDGKRIDHSTQRVDRLRSLKTISQLMVIGREVISGCPA